MLNRHTIWELTEYLIHWNGAPYKTMWTKGAHICFTANKVECASMTMGPNCPIKCYTVQELPDYLSNETDFWRCLWSISLKTTLPAWEAILQDVVYTWCKEAGPCWIYAYLQGCLEPWHLLAKIRMKCSSWWFIMICLKSESPLRHPVLDYLHCLENFTEG